MSYKTRTVRTIYTDGSGNQRTETRNYGGDDGGLSIGGFDIGGFASKFGGMNIDFGGFGGGGGGGGGYSRPSTQRPQVGGRATRKAKKNPFAGYGAQSYDEIIKMCREHGCLFEDPEFEAKDTSIFFSQNPPRPFEWKRPSEICSDPQFVSAGASRFDVQQGELGDCWLLAAVASLTCNPKLLNRIICPEQNFQEGSYYGVFKFNFWHQGDWTEIVVDDKLPTYNDRLVFMHSTDQNEFWSALLEKAYAKLNGSYESLKGGSTSEAMEDFTGGVTESIDLKKSPTNLMNIMLKATARGSLMGCSIDADPHQLEAQKPNGLVMGHAYSVTSIKLAEIQTPKVSGKIPLVRVRNPWGNEVEWKGAWSDSSAEWQYIPAAEKQNLGIVCEDDGEFWMSFEDWKDNFEKLEICNLGPDSLDEEDMSQGKIRWEAVAKKGEWIARVNAGGCRNFLDTFATNPQYRVELKDADDDDDLLCTMLVGLLQKDRRKKRKEGLDMLTIGYCIYKLKDDGSAPSGPLETRFFKYNASAAKSPSFINMREVCGRHKLEPGSYVIIPSTFEPNQVGEFLLRIFTEKAGSTSEIDEGTGMIENQRSHQQSYGSVQPQDPYENRQPLPLGFDQFERSVYNRPDPYPAISWGDFYGQSYPGAPQVPGSYQPNPYNPPPVDQGYNPYATPSSGPSPAGPIGFQGMPQAPTDPYNPSQGYQQQPGQYFPHPAYNAGYQPNQYGSAPPSGPGYQQNQYYQYPNPNPNQAGYAPPTAGYSPAQSYGMPSSYPTQPSYPYGQGEAMEQAHVSSGCFAEPGPDSGPPSGPPPPPPPARTAPAAPGRRGSKAGGMRSIQRPPSPIIRSYKEAIAFLRKQLEEGPPVTEEDQAQGQALRESFKMTAGDDMEIDAYELQEILNKVFTREFNFDGFSVDVCRSMVAMHDGDTSGKLGFDEFKTLWQDLRKWKAVFKMHDKDQSGKLSSYELRTAFRESGFRLSNSTMTSIILRYSDKKGEIEFDDFVLSAIRLKTMISSFKSQEIEGKFAAFDIDTFIQITMYS